MLPLPDDLDGIPDIHSLTLEELNKVPFDKIKWRCQIKHCNGCTQIRDYGILPVFFWRKKWLDLRFHYFLCGKHNHRYKGKIIPDHYFRSFGWEYKLLTDLPKKG